jgi:hypothetical protein
MSGKQVYKTGDGKLFVAHANAYDWDVQYRRRIRVLAMMKTYGFYVETRYADALRKRYNELHPTVPVPRTHLLDGEIAPANTVGCLLCATEQPATEYLIAIVHGGCAQAYCLKCLCYLIALKYTCPACRADWIEDFLCTVNSVFEEMLAQKMHTIESLTALMCE